MHIDTLPAVPPKTVKYTVVTLAGSTGPLMSSVKVTIPSSSDTDIAIEFAWKSTVTVTNIYYLYFITITSSNDIQPSTVISDQLSS